jgi:hypothetical protein
MGCLAPCISKEYNSFIILPEEYILSLSNMASLPRHGTFRLADSDIPYRADLYVSSTAFLRVGDRTYTDLLAERHGRGRVWEMMQLDTKADMMNEVTLDFSEVTSEAWLHPRAALIVAISWFPPAAAVEFYGWYTRNVVQPKRKRYTTTDGKLIHKKRKLYQGGQQLLQLSMSVPDKHVDTFGDHYNNLHGLSGSSSGRTTRFVRTANHALVRSIGENLMRIHTLHCFTRVDLLGAVRTIIGVDFPEPFGHNLVSSVNFSNLLFGILKQVYKLKSGTHLTLDDALGVATRFNMWIRHQNLPIEYMLTQEKELVRVLGLQ